MAVKTKNPLAARALVFATRNRIPFVSRMIKILLHSDIACRLPKTTIMGHPYGITIHSATKVGENAMIMQFVTIGAKDGGKHLGATIGCDVCIGAGATILGGVKIGDRVKIGANAVVTKNIPEGATVVGNNRIIQESR